MRIGLLGLGRIGAFHADKLTSLPAVDSLVVCDLVAALAAGTADRLGAEVAASPEAGPHDAATRRYATGWRGSASWRT